MYLWLCVESLMNTLQSFLYNNHWQVNCCCAVELIRFLPFFFLRQGYKFTNNATVSCGLNGLFWTLAPIVATLDTVKLVCFAHLSVIMGLTKWILPDTDGRLALSLCSTKWKGFDWQTASEVGCYVYNCQLHMQGLLVSTIQPTHFGLNFKNENISHSPFWLVSTHKY